MKKDTLFAAVDVDNKAFHGTEQNGVTLRKRHNSTESRRFRSGFDYHTEQNEVTLQGRVSRGVFLPLPTLSVGNAPPATGLPGRSLVEERRMELG